ncbi:NACHT domain-containing protein [Micromonospora aurantiaca (nom. illeg.)]|uniref:NACHT domain-containing protein n=1 Tax=Micromonospora aurantiaca (nom. illeg.) TaxID=47850 RepID=UPI00342A46D0
MRFDLTQLGPDEFEELSQALAVAVLGGAVSVFGEGRDGGREATFEGQMRYPDPLPATGAWDGYGILQAKYKGHPTTTTADTDWFYGHVRDELRKWADDESSRVKRGRRPEYIVFTTNVTLSPDPGRGGIDRINELIRGYQGKIGLKGWAVWHRDQICAYLAVHDGVRRTYGGLIVVGDVLAEAQRALARLSAAQMPETDFSTLLTTHAAKELMAQQWVRLGQSGDPTNRKLMLSDVAIDLPAHGRFRRPRKGFQNPIVPGVIAHVIREGDTIRRPRPGRSAWPHLAILGGPGQGKTTLTQMLCQVYRVALLSDRPEHALGPEVPDLLAQYRRHLQRLRIPTPNCRRWPINVPLNEYADALAADGSLTLLRYISERVRTRSPINSIMLREWLREWPWLVVLDGLDEVASPEIRERMLSAVSDFYVDAAHLEADLLVVATTRPQGYRDEFAERIFDRLTLQPMEPSHALDYAGHLAKVRYNQDPDLKAEVEKRLRVAAAEPVTARLMRTPLQVTIMSLLLERRARAPQDRYGLFESYYNTLYDREIGKNTTVSRLLDDQRRNIDHLHERVGLLLQIRAEHAGEAESQLPEEELHRLARARLIAEEYSHEDAVRLATDLVHAATNRLVMLVGRDPGNIGFEVRSLQEVMAARALSAGGGDELLQRLKELAPSAHWRNTWLFAVSRLFARQEHLRDAMITLLQDIDSDGALATYLMPGARLAMEMLDEDITVGQPRYNKLLIRHALRLLDSYPGEAMTRLATVLNDASATDRQIDPIAHQIIDSKIAAGGRPALTAVDLLAAWADLPGPVSIKAKHRIARLRSAPPAALNDGLEHLRRFSPRPVWFDGRAVERPEPEPTAEVVERKLRAGDLPRAEQEKITAIVRRLAKGASDLTELVNSQRQDQLAAIGGELDIEQWPHGADLQQAVLHWYARQPVTAPSVVSLTQPSP